MVRSKEEFKVLIQQLYENNKKSNEWLDKVPTEISSAFFDNPYVDYLQKTNNILLCSLLDDETLVEEVQWFIHEWNETSNENCKTICLSTGKKYVISSVDSFVDYICDLGYFTV